MTEPPYISPGEMMVYVINTLGPFEIQGLAVAGPATDAQQQAGVISVVDAGLPVVERFRRVVWVRTQYRCLGGSLAKADELARRLHFFLNDLPSRTVGLMASTGEQYLIHEVTVTAGPSWHFDSPETWEALLFTESLIGLDPI